MPSNRKYLLALTAFMVAVLVFSPLSASMNAASNGPVSASHSQENPLVDVAGHSTPSTLQSANATGKNMNFHAAQSPLNLLGNAITSFNSSPVKTLQAMGTTYSVTISVLNHKGEWSVEIFNSMYDNSPLLYSVFNSSTGLVYQNSTSSSTMKANLPDGNYIIYAGAGASFLMSEEFQVEGLPVNLGINLPHSYSVSVSVSSLPASHKWNVYATNSNNTYIAINTTGKMSMTIYLPNSTYEIFIGPVGTLESYSMSYVVNGSATAIKYTFPALYSFTVNEKNVPKGLPWYVEALSYSGYNMTIFVGSSYGTSVTGYLPGGTYAYIGILDYELGAIGSFTGEFNLTQSGLVLTIVFPYMEKVTFSVHNQMAGMYWELSLTNSTGAPSYLNQTYSSSMTAYLQNGTYSVVMEYDSEIAVTSSINITGPGLSFTFNLPNLYKITFLNLHPQKGTSWELTIKNATDQLIYLNYSSSGAMVAYLPDGNYSYSIAVMNLTVESGLFEVNGTAAGIVVMVPHVYTVTFVESGIQKGFFWTLIVNENTSLDITSGSSTDTSLSVGLINGTYSFDVSIYNPPYNVISYSNFAPVTVNGANLTVDFSTPELYNVTFVTGFPSGLQWSITMDSTDSSFQYSNTVYGNSLTVFAPNETYSVTASAQDYSIPVLSFTVDGSNLVFRLAFPQFYVVTFDAANVTSYQSWNVDAFNRTSYYSISNSQDGPLSTMYETNGSYWYTATIGIESIGSDFTVLGKNLTVNVPLPAVYNLTFKQTGLSSFDGWEVSIGTALGFRTYMSFGASLIILAPNGSYSYRISLFNGELYLASPSSGSVTVNGKSIVISIQFTGESYVNFVESTLPRSAKWNSNYTDVAASMETLSQSGGAYVMPMFSFNSSGMVMNGTRNSAEVTGIGTSASFSGGFTVNITAEVLSGTGYAVTILLENAQRSEYMAVSVDACSTDIFDYGMYYGATGVGAGPYNLSRMYSSPHEGIAYTYSLSVSSTGIGTVNVYNGSALVVSRTGFTVGTGPFYLYLGQSIDYPSTLFDPTVSLWKSVAVTGSSGTTLFSENFADGPVWTVSLGGYTESSETGTVTLLEKVGNYSYTVASATDKYMADPSSGSLRLSGSEITVAVTFGWKYYVNFDETGIPSGSQWGITFNGVSQKSSAATDTFAAVNGTYHYTVGNLTAYYDHSYAGTVTVNGGNVTVGVTYDHYAYITGRVNPSNATVLVNGKVIPVSSNGSFNVSVIAGNYNVTAEDAGYSPYSTNFTLTAGQTEYVAATLSPAKVIKTPGTASSPFNYTYLLIGAGIAAAVVVAAVLLMKKKE